MATTTKTYTGLEIITEAKVGEYFRSTTIENRVIIRDEQTGHFVNELNSREPIVIDSSFLVEKFVKVRLVTGNEPAPTRDYISLEEALQAFTHGLHVHYDVFVPNAEPEYDQCFNGFLMISELTERITEGVSNPFELMAKLAEIHQEGISEEEFDQLTDPLSASIPVGVLLYGKFFIEGA